MSATDKYYGGKKKTSKEIHRAAGCAVVDIPGRLHQGAAGACMVLEEAGHVLREERVPLQAEPPAGAEGEAGASGPQSPGHRTGSTGRGGAWSGTRLGRGFPVSSAASQAGKGTAAVYGYGNTVIIMLRVP